ncbi:MAG: hypothetical protein IKG85_06485 [Clostridia bacterium]|nr:hypothetical protein [Clostridia bacterium]
MNELKELEVDEVSLVDAGANPEAHIVFFKRKEEKSMAKKETAAEVVKQEELQLDVTKTAEPIIDAEKDELQKRVAELEAQLAERDAAEKAAVEKAAQEKLAADNAEISAAFERLNQRFEAYVAKAEESELLKVASKYEILGEKAEELAPVLKKMKAAGVYDEYISKLDRELALVKKSGTFDEIGKTGAGYAQASIEGIAKKLMEADPKLTEREAIDRAFQLHPELEY